MKFGVREICDVVFKAKSDVKIGNTQFKKGQPVLYIDSAKTSTMEGAATTVYATGGKGNTRLIAWEGEKTLTFTVEDALLSPLGFAILSGAGLLTGKYGPEKQPNIHIHRTTNAMAGEGEIDLTDALAAGEKICKTAPTYIMVLDQYGDMKGTFIEGLTVDESGKKLVGTIAKENQGAVFVDYYVLQSSEAIDEMQIDAENFAGYYYVEASTLFRRQADGVDMPAELTFPNVKIQSNFTFSMASTGDPSTFTFTMDAFPGYTYFNPTRKVLCAMQIVKDTEAISTSAFDTVFPHNDDESIEEAGHDSVSAATAMDPETETDLGEKTAADLMEDDAFISDNGDVIATLKEIKDAWTEFDSSGDNTGYFFPIEIDVPEAKTMTMSKTTEFGGKYSESKKNIEYDPKIVIRVFDGQGMQKIFDFKVETFDKDKKPLTTTELHFTGITLKPADERE